MQTLIEQIAEQKQKTDWELRKLAKLISVAATTKKELWEVHGQVADLIKTLKEW